MHAVLLCIVTMTADIAVRTEGPSEAEMEERQGLAICNVGLSSSGGLQRKGIHWRRGITISQGETNGRGLRSTTQCL